MRTRTLALTVTVAGLLLAPAAASAASLGLKVKGLSVAPLARNLVLPAAETHTRATLTATLSGSLPAGARVRLATRASSVAPFRLASGVVRFHHGRATLHVTAHAAATIAYKLVAVAGGRTVASSRVRSIFWIHPPIDLVVADDGDNASLNISRDALTNCTFPAGPTACQD